MLQQAHCELCKEKLAGKLKKNHPQKGYLGPTAPHDGAAMCQVVTRWEIRVCAPSKPISALSFLFFLHPLLPFLSKRLGEGKENHHFEVQHTWTGSSLPFLGGGSQDTWSTEHPE